MNDWISYEEIQRQSNLTDNEMRFCLGYLKNKQAIEIKKE